MNSTSFQCAPSIAPGLRRSRPVSITGFAWLMPFFNMSATPNATFFPIQVSVRNNASIVDNDPTNARSSGGKVVDTITAATDWVSLINANIYQDGGYAWLPAFSAVTIAPHTKAAFWFRFTDMTKPMRSNPPKLGTSPYVYPNVSSTDITYQIFNTTSDGALSITWAMQATDYITANWGNVYTFSGDVKYTTCDPPPAPPSPPFAPPPPPGPPRPNPPPPV